MTRPPVPAAAAAFLLSMSFAMPPGVAADANPAAPRPQGDGRPDGEEWSGLEAVVLKYAADRRALERLYDLPGSAADRDRLKQYDEQARERLAAVPFSDLGRDGQVDYLLLRNEIDHALRTAATEADLDARVADLLPFLPTIERLEQARRKSERPDPAAAAGDLAAMADAVVALREQVEAGKGPTVAPPDALHAAGRIEAQRRSLGEWYRFYEGYDPEVTWWAKEPFGQADKALGEYAAAVKKTLAKVAEKDDDAIVGRPIGRDALLSELAHEMIVYTPEQLLAIADREFVWCEGEMKKAAAELGYGDDWKQAVEYIKRKHVKPGEQPELIRTLAEEAAAFVTDRDLVTVPPLCRETWRMEMMTPDRQRVTPFFTGGEVVSVSFPTSGMTHEEKQMSLRGNNVHFARATVHHELIPGHHLQQFMTSRHRPYRQIFDTPFWTEGWALYWEMRLYDLDFARSAEDRVGMLFWRMHRCARIVFSLKYHLGEMTPDEAIDFLVDRVGHERRNAAGEVRRSVQGGYSPLYQCAYMLGGLQFRALQKEVVGSGKMTDRDFHDAILKHGRIPVDLVRATLTDVPLSPDYAASWTFYGGDPLGEAGGDAGTLSAVKDEAPPETGEETD